MSGRHGRTLTRILVLAVGVVLAIPYDIAGADPVALTGGKSARFRAFVTPTRNNAVITISSDDALQPVLDPIACPADPTLRIRASDGFDSGAIVLPCGGWRRAGTGYKYADRLAAISGVHSVVYSKRRLVIKLKGASYPALIGPLGFPPGIEVAFSTGNRDYCARFETFKRNEAGYLFATKPSLACLVPTPTASPSPTPTPSPTPAFVCPAGTTCSAFDVVPGPGDLLPVDDGSATWLRLFDFTGAGVFGNAANGLWGPDRVVLAMGAASAGGVAPLSLVGTTYLGADFVDIAQQLGTQGTICVRIEQDPLANGWIDCDGGRDPDVALAVDSNGGAAANPSILSVPGGAEPTAAAGAAVVRVRLRFAVAPANDAACSSVDYSASPIIESAFTTGVAASVVENDWINGAPGAAGPNETSLAGQPFACGGWGMAGGASASIVAPLYALDFTAPIVNQVVDLAQVFRLELAPASAATPAPTPSPTATAPTATPSPSATASPGPTATPTPAATATPSPTPSAVPTASATPSPTPPPVPTTVPAQITALTITDASSNWGPDYTALGNCYDGARSSTSIVAQSPGAFATRFQQSVASDCEAVPTGGGGVSADATADYTVGFAVTCPAGSTYQLTVASTLRGAHTINRDNGDGCDLPFFGSTLDSQAQLSAVSGSLTGGTLSSGSLGLVAPADLTSAPDADAGFLRSSSAVVSGAGTGGAVAHALRFQWTARCSSSGDSFSTGSECAVRLGLTSALDPNGIAACMSADDYPGVGSRIAADDGHLVSVSGVCTTLVTAPTPTPQPTASPVPTQSPAPTATPAVTPTPVPTATPIVTPTPTVGPLGPLSFTVATGSSSYCPADSAAGSFLKTHGNPTGGVPGTVCSGTKGAFTSGPLMIEGGAPDLLGRADLILAAPVVIGVDLDTQTPNCGGSCGACWRFEDDPASLGFVDCDGGSNADQTLIVNSNTTAAPPAPLLDPAWWTLPSGASNGGAGAAIVRVRVKRMRVNGTTTCPGVNDAAWSSRPSESLALVTGQATTRIDSPRRCTGSLFGTACPNANPFTVTLTGSNLSCASWTTNSGARLVIPFVNLDENLGSTFGTGDIAQVLRLNH